MNKIEESYQNLAELQELDPRIFYPDLDKGITKELCGFILGLSLFSNDIRTIHIFYDALYDSKPIKDDVITRDSGDYNGMRIFLDRLLSSYLFELFKLIEDNQMVIKSKYFKGIINKLNKKTKWNDLVALSIDKNFQKKDYKDLLLIRNKVSFHYDSKELSRGFKYFFTIMKPDMNAYMSVGDDRNKTRFYFADASAQGYLEEKTKFTNEQRFYDTLKKYLDDFNNVIKLIILFFIYK